MLSKYEKKFFADIAWGASRLSDCTEQRGAALINGQHIASYGFNRKIIRGHLWEISAIYDAIFGASDKNMENFTLFSTHPPYTNDLILVISVGITTLYYFGDISDIETIKFLKSLNETISLQLIKLE